MIPYEEFVCADGLKMSVHTKNDCEGPCPIHGPSDHPMKTWPLKWRQEHYYFERICPHGIGHPDPDSLAYLEWSGIVGSGAGVHGCDGCCSAPKAE